MKIIFLLLLSIIIVSCSKENVPDKTYIIKTNTDQKIIMEEIEIKKPSTKELEIFIKNYCGDYFVKSVKIIAGNNMNIDFVKTLEVKINYLQDNIFEIELPFNRYLTKSLKIEFEYPLIYKNIICGNGGEKDFENNIGGWNVRYLLIDYGIFSNYSFYNTLEENKESYNEIEIEYVKK
jgi:hypothetical protein